MTRKLGPYELRSELGRGAMAQVWRAYDAVLDREVALKEPLLPKGVESTIAAEYGARFVREGRAAAKLNHPNIVTIHAADIYDGRAALVMELVEGVTLGELLSRGPLDRRLALGLMEQLLLAVGYAHARGIVHRDIKPDNIFVTPEGRLKLADFGIASLATDATLTQAGTIMGTPGYMAPEQITGDPVDARADLFALGVLFYEMLTGHNPFGASEGLPTTTIMYRIVHQAPPELPLEALAGLPVDLRPVLGVAMAKDPGSRFPDAGSFLAALRGEGPLPVPGAAGVHAAGPRAGTMMARAAMLRQRTMIGHPAGPAGGSSWLHSWLPYAAVAGIGLIVMIALLVAAKTGGGAIGVTLSAPTNVSATAVSSSEIVVTWTDNSSNETGFWVSDGLEEKSAPADSTSYTWSGLAFNTSTRIQVQAYNSGGESLWSESVKVATDASGRPAAAAGVGDDWPGYNGWTVIVKNYAADTATGESQAKAYRDRLIAKGIPAGVIYSSDYSSLSPGWWAVFSDVFSTKAEAQAWRARILSWGYAAYIRQVIK